MNNFVPKAELPAAGRRQDIEPGLRPSAAEKAAAPDDDTISILIVDDEPKNLTALEAVLDDPGYRLVRAESAEQALLALVVEEFALLILDIRMPGMTGFELAQMIKQRKKTSRVPIIFLTAYYNEDQHVLEGYQTGAVDYLQKPANPTILRSKVAVFAELHRKSREVSKSNRTLLSEVTQRRRAEDQLRELNDTLEQRVTERTTALRTSEEQLRAIYDGTFEYMGLLTPDGILREANRTALEFSNCQIEDVVGVPFWNTVWFQFTPGAPEVVRQAVLRAAAGEPVRTEILIITPSGEKKTFDFSLRPIRDERGEVILIVPAGLDITERRRAEEALRDNERHFREMIDALPAAVYTTDAHGWLTHFNPASMELAGRTPLRGADRWCVSWKLYCPDGTPQPLETCVMAVALQQGKVVRGTEYIVERPDGSRIWVTSHPALMRGTDQRIIGGVNMLVDISERNRSEARQAMLVRELQHRTKNMLAVVQSVASKTLTNSRSVDGARETLIARLHSLGHATELLMDADWLGASLKEVVERALKPFPNHYSIDGECIMLNPIATQGFSLVVHELCTNAHKYGAFHTPQGTVAIRWSVEGQGEGASLLFHWQERGGPPVIAPGPTSFGAQLLSRAISDSKVSFNYAIDGLIYSLKAPLDSLVADFEPLSR